MKIRLLHHTLSVLWGICWLANQIDIFLDSVSMLISQLRFCSILGNYFCALQKYCFGVTICDLLTTFLQLASCALLHCKPVVSVIEVLLNTVCMLYCSQSTPMANGLKRTWNGQYQQYVREICDSADLLQRMSYQSQYYQDIWWTRTTLLMTM